MKILRLIFLLLVAAVPGFAQFGASNIQNFSTNWGKCGSVGCAGGAADATSTTQTFGPTSLISMTGPPNSNALFYFKLAGSTANSAVSFSDDFTIQLGANGATAQTFEYDTFQFVGGMEYMFGWQCNQVRGFWQVWDQLHIAWVNTPVACSLSVLASHHIQRTMHRVPGSTLMYFDTLTIDGTPYAINMTEPAGPTTFADAIGTQFQMDEGASGTSLTETILSASFSASGPTGPGGFTDNFNTGTLDSTKWVIDTGAAPGNITGQNVGTFSAANVDLTQNVLAMKLTQSGGAPVTSVGAEVRSIVAYGYGTYEWTYRTASTATTPTGSGTCVSGSDSGGFNFINASQTEIDFETEGQFCDRIEMTNWKTTAAKQFTQYTLIGPDQAFHRYRFDWSAAKIDFYIDGILVSTHTQNIPTAPAYILMNIWGTNSTSFGGLATTGTPRWLYISKFQFTPALGQPAPPTGLVSLVQ